MNLKIMESKTVNIASEVNYSDQSIVSRSLIKKPAGNITLFAFDKEQALSEHTAPFDAFVHVIEGEAKITISGKPYMLKENDTIILPANIPHAVYAITRFKMILVLIKK